MERREEEIRKILSPFFSGEQVDALTKAIIKASNELTRASEFSEIKEILKELAEAQKRTEISIRELVEAQRENEKRLTRLEEIVQKLEDSLSKLAEAQRKTEERVNELAEAQRRTEERLNELAEAQRKTEERVNELAEAQRKTEERVNELAEAQRKTEERLNELAEAQRKTEERLLRLEDSVSKLAEAQKKTEMEIANLAKEHKRTRELLAGISDTVGYSLEDRAILYMEDFCKKEFAIEVELVDRRNIVYPDGKFDEINIYIEGRKNGQKVYVIGECKARPGKKEIDSILEVAKRVKKHLKGDVYPFIIGYYYSPDVEKYLKEKGSEIKALKSFELEMKYERK
jgi:chromosome segregation ATPase